MAKTCHTIFMAEESEKQTDVNPDSDSPVEADSLDQAIDQNEDSDEISLDDIDALISEAAPDFEDDLKDIEESSSDTEGVELADAGFHQKSLSFEERFPKIYTKLLPIIRIFQKLKKFGLLFTSVFGRSFRWIGQIFGFFKHNFLRLFDLLKFYIPIFGRFLLSNAKDFAGYFISQLKNFVKLPWKVKLLGFVALASAVLTVLAAIKSTEGIWLPILKDKPVTSFYGKAQYVGTFSSPPTLQMYHNAFPQPEYTLLLKHMVVSLKRATFETTPMAAFEFFLNLDSQDTAIEVKDREPQVLDAIQRIIEGYTYEELSTFQGLKDMKRDIRKEVNSMLNFGLVRDVYIKTKVLKP
ncbi:MAG: flagellar basal body-associated FliL family protein [Bdellovibrionales bacterium]